jgi:AcrR family transcriptional regulator
LLRVLDPEPIGRSERTGGLGPLTNSLLTALINLSYIRSNDRTKTEMTASLTTRAGVLAAAKEALIELGYAQLSTRRIAEIAGVPLSQIHYHFGSKQNLVLELLADENARLLSRQADMYAANLPLWKQWEQACDFLDRDIESGYVRVLQEMMAAGWSDPAIAAAVRKNLEGWFTLLQSVAESARARLEKELTLAPAQMASLVGAAFLGAEAMILLGFQEQRTRQALRAVAKVLKKAEGR